VTVAQSIEFTCGLNAREFVNASVCGLWKWVVCSQRSRASVHCGHNAPASFPLVSQTREHDASDAPRAQGPMTVLLPRDLALAIRGRTAKHHAHTPTAVVLCDVLQRGGIMGARPKP
jgi:hypothetical protein